MKFGGEQRLEPFIVLDSACPPPRPMASAVPSRARRRTTRGRRLHVTPRRSTIATACSAVKYSRWVNRREHAGTLKSRPERGRATPAIGRLAFDVRRRRTFGSERDGSPNYSATTTGARAGIERIAEHRAVRAP